MTSTSYVRRRSDPFAPVLLASLLSWAVAVSIFLTRFLRGNTYFHSPALSPPEDSSQRNFCAGIGSHVPRLHKFLQYGIKQQRTGLHAKFWKEIREREANNETNQHSLSLFLIWNDALKITVGCPSCTDQSIIVNRKICIHVVDFLVLGTRFATATIEE